MTITVTWDNENKTTILICYTQPWTLVEFVASREEVKRLTASVSYRVDTIIDVSDGGTPPKNAIGHFLDALKEGRDSQGTVVFVGGNLLARTLIQTAQRIAQSSSNGDPMRFAATREEARTLLKSLKESPSNE